MAIIYKKYNPLDEQIGGSHYKDFPIQPATFIHRNKLNWLQGTIIEYICRYPMKGKIDSLEKAKHCIDLLIELENDLP